MRVITVGHIHDNTLLNFSAFERDQFVLNFNEILAFDGGNFTCSFISIADGVQDAANFSIATIGTHKHNWNHLILAFHFDLSLSKTDAAWLVVVLNRDHTFSVRTCNTMFLFIDELDFEILIRLPALVILDLDLDLTLLLCRVHSDQLVFRNVVFACLSCAVDSAHPEGELVGDLLFNSDCDGSVRLRNLVSKMLEAHSLAIVLRSKLLLTGLSHLALVKTDEISSMSSADLFAVSDTFNSVVWLETVEQFVNSCIKGGSW